MNGKSKLIIQLGLATYAVLLSKFGNFDSINQCLCICTTFIMLEIILADIDVK